MSLEQFLSSCMSMALGKLGCSLVNFGSSGVKAWPPFVDDDKLPVKLFNSDLPKMDIVLLRLV
jgi:hypothetical protein